MRYPHDENLCFSGPGGMDMGTLSGPGQWQSCGPQSLLVEIPDS